jgi:alkanesulfonate monooxygenase SsuD/methylene tetrahydromethanopterin reductase-like flavin-dependent oxidoreductase (luciferase family)
MDRSLLPSSSLRSTIGITVPVLAAIGARTRKIEIGTGVIDMPYENPHYMAEDAGAADLIAGFKRHGNLGCAARHELAEFDPQVR